MRAHELWEAMADQFLDTETRAAIPALALRCAALDLSPEAAFEVWAYEVTPAVWPNLWSMVGEWAGWDRAWLVARIERQRARPSKLRYVQYRCRAHIHRATWRTIDGCMRLLLASPPARREGLARELTWLAERYFDFGCCERPSDTASLRALFERTFEPLFATLVVPSAGESKAECQARVEAALNERAQAVG